MILSAFGRDVQLWYNMSGLLKFTSAFPVGADEWRIENRNVR